MKRLSYILLAAMLVAALAVSCTAEVVDDAELATIMFASGEGSRSLVVSREGFDAEQYVWYYTAAKSDKGPDTGAKSEKTLVGGTGKLTSPIEGISLGKWDFQLFGYDKKIDEGGVVVYTGSAIDAKVLKGHDNVISVKVEPQKNGKGYIDVSKAIVLVDGNGNATAYNASNVEIKGLDTGFSKLLVVSDEWKVEVPSGSYAVTVRFVSESGTEHASTTKYFNVYDGLTTRVSGTLEEMTSSVSFDVKSDDIGLSISENKTIGSENVYKFGFSPVSSETTIGKDEQGTTITGSFKKTNDESSATINLVVYNTASAVQKFSVENGDAVVAGFDFTLDNASIEEGSYVEVSTYIGTGYTNPKVVYKGNASEEFETSYDSGTGILTFKTSHFSEYYVITEDACVLNENTKQKYIYLQDAIDNASDGDTIRLLGDVVLENTVVVDKKLTLDLEGRTMSNISDLWNESTGDWSLVSVRENGNLTITGNGTLQAKKNDCFTVDVQDANATVTIESGTLVGNVHAVYVEKGSAYINGGIYSVQQKYSTSKPDEFVLNCYDPNYQGEDLPDGKGGIRKYTGPASIVVTGGKFENFNPADCYAEGAHTNFVDEGYISVKDEDGISYTVREKRDSDIAMVDGVVYSSLAEAIENAASNSIIRLLRDASGDGIESKDYGKASYREGLTIDFSGYTYTMTNSSVGSEGEENKTQAMHWGGSIGFVVLKNGKFKVGSALTSDGRHIIAMQNYVNFTAEDMEFDFESIAVGNYPKFDKDNFNYPDFAEKEIPLFNNNKGKMLLVGCTVKMPIDSTKGIYAGGDGVTLKDTIVDGYVNLQDSNSRLMTNGSSSVKGVVSYFDNGNVKCSVSDGITTYYLEVIE